MSRTEEIHRCLHASRCAQLGLQVIIWQFDRIVEGFLPKVHAALAKHGVNSEYYAIQWPAPQTLASKIISNSARHCALVLFEKHSNRPSGCL